MIGLTRYGIHIHTHIQNGKLLSNKKEWNTATCSNMDGPRENDVPWEIQYSMTSLIYGI